MPTDQQIIKFSLTASIGLFLLSLTQPCYCTTSHCADSIMAFLLGWAAFLSGGAGFFWLANPLLITAWFMLKRKLKTAMFLSVLAFTISLSFLMAGSIVSNESGHVQSITSYKAGYWLWTASSLIMLMGTFVLMLRYNTRKKNGQQAV